MRLKGKFTEKITTRTDFIPLAKSILSNLSKQTRIFFYLLSIPGDVFPEPVISSSEIQCFGTFLIMYGIWVAFFSINARFLITVLVNIFCSVLPLLCNNFLKCK